MENKTNIGEQLKKVRETHGLSQTEFAQIMHITPGSVSRYESGIRKPGPRLVKDICQRFGINQTWLYTGNGEMFETLSPLRKFLKKKGIDDEDITVIDAYLSMNPFERKAFRSFLATLAVTLNQEDSALFSDTDETEPSPESRCNDQ